MARKTKAGDVYLPGREPESSKRKDQNVDIPLFAYLTAFATRLQRPYHRIKVYLESSATSRLSSGNRARTERRKTDFENSRRPILRRKFLLEKRIQGNHSYLLQLIQFCPLLLPFQYSIPKRKSHQR
jgi:hypothetical protein